MLFKWYYRLELLNKFFKIFIHFNHTYLIYWSHEQLLIFSHKKVFYHTLHVLNNLTFAYAYVWIFQTYENSTTDTQGNEVFMELFLTFYNICAYDMYKCYR